MLWQLLLWRLLPSNASSGVVVAPAKGQVAPAGQRQARFAGPFAFLSHLPWPFTACCAKCHTGKTAESPFCIRSLLRDESM